jgi:hypothetical protein
MPAFPNFSFPSSQTHANNAFAPAQIDFSKIGQLYDSYSGAQNDRMKRDAFQEQQAAAKAERDRQGQVRQAFAQGVPRDAQGNLDYNAMSERLLALDPNSGVDFLKLGSQEADRRHTREFDQKKFDAEQTYRQQQRALEREKLSKTGNGVDFSQREAAARAYGLDPNSDAGRAFILTGKMPREDQQALTATDKKAILEADEMVSVNQGAINALDEANRLSPQAYDGMLASQRAWLANNLWPGNTPQAEATSNLDNAVVGNALSQLKAIFGAAPTEGERKILLELQGSANQPAKVREQIYARARAAAVKRLQFNEDRAAQLRGGTFYKPQSATGPQPAPSGLGGAPIRAKNPQTGEQIEWNGQQWVPVQ